MNDQPAAIAPPPLDPAGGALSIGAAVDRLEQLIADPAFPVEELAALGDPRRLDLLLNVLLGTLLRRGPRRSERSPTVGDLLAAAARGAAEGLVPVATLLRLRGTLDFLEDSLRLAAALHRAAPPWWHPLPQPSEVEKLAAALSDRDARLPDESSCAAALASTSFAAVQALLSPSWCRLLHEQLEAAWQDGGLGLEPGAVGADGRITLRRSDLVLYLTGLEAEILHRAPALAVLVQWGLERLEAFLRQVHPGAPVFSPQRAMLTRYPAPSGGYEVHIDNPGSRDDNGRELTVVLYLNAPERGCSGGDLAVWSSPSCSPCCSSGGHPQESKSSGLGTPASTVAACGGNAIFFESRKIPHQVLPLAEGPARWALTFWFSDTPQGPPAPAPPPLPSMTELLLPMEDPRLPPERLLFHEIPAPGPSSAIAGEIHIHPIGRSTLRPGIVSTVYRAGPFLETWCEHHFAAGFAHLLLIFDHLDAEAGLAQRLRSRYSPAMLTIWAGQDLAAEGWSNLGTNERLESLRRGSKGGGASVAHAARQALNAQLALEAARTDALGGAPLDWLLHLDADELFCLEGRARGGNTAQEHFACAGTAGFHQIRYLNHELLLPHEAGSPARFKVNPRLAAARLGVNGWQALMRYLEMAQTAQRPYFRAYHNGKSAVLVNAASGSAGVHGWRVGESALGREVVLAGPSILHLHLPMASSFRRTYLAKANEEPQEAREEAPPLFEASPLETAALDCIRSLDGAPAEKVVAALDALYRQRTFFEANEVEILAEAGLVLQPDLPALNAWLPGGDPGDPVEENGP